MEKANYEKMEVYVVNKNGLTSKLGKKDNNNGGLEFYAKKDGDYQEDIDYVNNSNISQCLYHIINDKVFNQVSERKKSVIAVINKYIYTKFNVEFSYTPSLSNINEMVLYKDCPGIDVVKNEQRKKN